MRKIAAWGVVITLCILLFGIWVYPTQYQYTEYKTGDLSMPVKINRFTGETVILVPQEGWRKVANSWTD